MTKVLKFGGSALSTPEAFRLAVSIAAKELQQERGAIAVSALKGAPERIL